MARNNQDVEWWNQEEARLFNKWASSFENYHEGYNNPYFDYFFTGQDVQITIDGLSDEADILPIYAFGYNVVQKKMPLYGFWDYTYRSMLRGTRLVTGVFSIVSMYPYLLTGKIAKAARNRAKAADQQSTYDLYSLHKVDEDERRMDRYWRRHYDENLDHGQQHLFSIHPPFNFVLKYGLQDTSLVTMAPQQRVDETIMKNKQSSPMMMDYNDRLIENPQPELDVKIILEYVDLMDKSVEYNSEGDPLLETYTFVARDERFDRSPDQDSLRPVVSDSELDPQGNETNVPTGRGGATRIMRYI